MTGGPFVCFLAQTGVENTSFTLEDSISGHLGRFYTGAFSGRRALTIEHSLMSGCVQGREPTENMSIKPQLKFPVLASSRSENTDHGRYP